LLVCPSLVSLFPRNRSWLVLTWSACSHTTALGSSRPSQPVTAKPLLVCPSLVSLFPHNRSWFVQTWSICSRTTGLGLSWLGQPVHKEHLLHRLDLSACSHTTGLCSP
ncbi:hypothetical protein ElyMa_004618400, partial [Elysia marginata]